MKSDQIYPNGHYNYLKDLTKKDFLDLIEKIEQIPLQLKLAVSGLTENQLDTSYIDGSWSIRQIVHHIADTQYKNYMRIKIALTEDNPVIISYSVDKWSDLIDSSQSSIESSLLIIEGLHNRWADLLKTLTKEQFKRTFKHSDKGEISIDKAVGIYAWHGHHHIGQINSLRKRKDW